MDDNLIKTLTELSKEVIKSSEITDYVHDKKSLNRAVKSVRKKGFDAIHRFRTEDVSVGEFSNWNPEIFISDYGYELLNKEANRASKNLFQSLNIVCESGCSNIDEVLTLLLLLKGPFKKNEHIKHPFLFSGHDYFLETHDAFQMLPNELFEGNPFSSEELPPESPLMLDYFIEENEASSTPVDKRPSLWDFVDGPPPLKPKPVLRSPRKKTTPEPVTSESPSKWSDIEPFILDGTEFLIEELTVKTSFADDYENALNSIKYGLLNEEEPTSTETKPAVNLPLALQMHDRHLSRLCGLDVPNMKLREISVELYIQQAKCLLMGFEGDIFKFDKTGDCFKLVDGVYVDGYSPSALVENSENLLLAGKIVKRLKEQCEEATCFDNEDFSLVRPAFWKSVQDYIKVHCKEIAEIPENLEIMSFRLATYNIHAPLSAVKRLVEGLQRDCNWRCGPLLTYLYEASRSTMTPEVQNIIFSFLYDCCYVYFSKLVETWMFHGIIDKHIKNDLFVKEREEIAKDRPRDRTFYQSVLLDETAVPSFLQALAARIFSCGKAIWLLRLCDPENKLIYFLEKQQHPRLRPCTTDQEFAALDCEVMHYEAAVFEVCGDNSAFVRIRESELHEEQEKIVQIKAMQLLHEGRNKIRRERLLEEKRLKIQKEKAFLNEQMEAITLKAEKKREDREKSLKEEKEVNTMNVGRGNILEEERKKLQEKYREMTKAAEEDKEHSDWRTRRWQLHEQRMEFQKEDLLNQNAVQSTVVDSEGNIVETELDVANANVTYGIEEQCLTIEQEAMKRIKHKNLESHITFSSDNAENINTHQKTAALYKKPNEWVPPWISSPPKLLQPTLMEISPLVENIEFLAEENKEAAQQNKLKIMGTTASESVAKEAETILTVGQKNKMKNLAVTEEHRDAIVIPDILTDAMKNKMKVLQCGQEADEEKTEATHVQTEAEKNKLRVLGTEYNLTEEGTVETPKEMTDAMRNKLKVLGTESEASEEIKANQVPPEQLTGAMKNKLKVLGAEYYLPVEEKLEDTNQTFILTDAMRNKLRVLGAECELQEETSEEISEPVHLTEAMRNKLRVLGADCELKEETPPENNEPVTLTEAMRNKLKVLGVEYNLEIQSSFPKGISTDAANNKEKMMESNINEPMTSSPPAKQSATTDAQKNKLKILGTDFDLPPLEFQAFANDEPLTEYQRNRQRMFRTVLKTQKESVESPENLIQFSTPIIEDENYPELSPLQIDLSHSLESASVQPIFNEITADIERPSLGEMDIFMFARHLQRSLRIAINVQERLANSAILKYFYFNENLLSHVTALRSYFLLHDGEFSRTLTHGLFISLNECKGPREFFSRGGLSNILNEALIHSNGLHDNLSFQIVKMPKELNLQAHDTLTPFQLSYKVKWPLNIIITDITIEKYRRVFHILINLKRTHWTLNETFLLLKSQAKENGVDGIRLMHSPEYTKLATYRHAMTLFIMTLEDHMCAEGPQIAWENFLKQIETVPDLDHLYSRYIAYVKDICQRCFLMKSTQDLLSYIHEMIETALKFHYILKSSTWHLINEQHYSHPKYEQLKSLFQSFCGTTRVFTKTLRKKVREPDMKMHISVLQLINLKMKVAFD